MKARTSPVKEVAERHGVSTQTIKNWIRKAGYNLPRLGKGRYTLLIPEWMEERIVEKRVPRIPRISESRRPRPKAPASEGQQTTGDQTKA